MRHSLIAAFVLASLCASSVARAQNALPPEADPHATNMDHSPEGIAVTPADKAYAASMRTMMKTMNTRSSGNADKDFVMMMMPHHRGAIDMAKVELRYGKDLMLRELATGIIKAQESEIAEMKGWLARHGN